MVDLQALFTSNPVRTTAIDYLKKILTAKVYDVAVETELKLAPSLSVRIGSRVYLKRENDQSVFSFKLRGVYNKMASLAPAGYKRGVITTSVGNHAQGVAFNVTRMECKAVIYVPVMTLQLKIDGVCSRGGDWVDAVPHGKNYSDAYSHAAKLQEKHDYAFVHPFDDPEVIAGQDTIAMEILRQHPQPIHTTFCSIGDGGSISGIAAYVKTVQPGVKVASVQGVDSNAVVRSVAAGKRAELKEMGLFADGTMIKPAGKEAFRLTRKLVDEIIIVDTDIICTTLKDMLQDTHSLLEPSDALALAGLKQHAGAYELKNGPLVAVASGVNMNFGRLCFVAEHAEVGETREAVFAMMIPEERGSFKRFCELVGQSRNVTEFNYRIANEDTAHTFVGMRIASHVEDNKITENLRKHGSPILDLSNNELAKQHIRYMVGGRSPLAENKHLYRFELPGRPGALIKFPSNMNPSWNISPFHCCNQSADLSNVLIGIQVPKNEKREFKAFLVTLGYTHWDESENPVYSLFL